MEKNCLNSNQAITVASVKTSILKTEITLFKAGNIVVISYAGDTIDNVKQGDLQVIGTIPPDYVPRQKIVIAPIQSTSQRIQLAFKNNGNIVAYNYGNEITAQTACRYNGCYVC
nr:MAG TPA: receptor binding protein [Caudoviricetes sp.]